MTKLFTLLGLFFFLSCSNSDDNANSEFIIGEWKAIERYEFDTEIELGPCDPYIVYQFKADNSMTTYSLQPNDVAPEVICGIIPLGAYYWEIIDEHTYELRRVSDNSFQNVTYQKENNNLIINRLTTNNKIVLSRY